MNNIPGWFVTVLSSGAQLLVTCSLPNSPAAQTVTTTVKVWANVLWQVRSWDKDLDFERLQKAFLSIAAQAERWPTPKMILDALPARAHQFALPRPDYPPEKAHNNLRKIRELIAGMGVIQPL